MRVRILILFILFGFDNLYSQTFDKTYCGISSDSLHDSPNLVFKNDSIVELSSVPRHMSSQLRMTFQYYKDNNQIIIPITQLSQLDSSKLTTYKFGQFTNSYTLKIDNKCLIDEKNNIVYVLEGYNSKNYILTWIIDGKEYRQKLGMSDSYGLIKKEPKKNRKLQRKMTELKGLLDGYDLKIYRGLEAYQKFGCVHIPGVYVLSKKK